MGSDAPPSWLLSAMEGSVTKGLVDRCPRGCYTKSRREMLLLSQQFPFASGLGLSQRAGSKLQFLFVIGLAKSARLLVLVVGKAVKGAENA